MTSKPRIAIIGAGPIGLEAALYARVKGYEVTVYERGDVAGNVRHWGHVRMFSPFAMNSSEWGRAALGAEGRSLPAPDALLTGDDFADEYLVPLSQLPDVRPHLCEKSRVTGITREHLLKTDFIGDPRRADDPFRILYSTGSTRSSRELSATALVVMDCSGNYPGIPLCAGGLERYDEYLMWSHTLVYHTPDVLGLFQPHYAGRRVLVVGAGHSAATSIVLLEQLAREDPATTITWVTRKSSDVPVQRIAHDSLPERDRLAEEANRIALDETSGVEWLPAHIVYDTDGGRRDYKVKVSDALRDKTPMTVTLESLPDGRKREIVVDQIIANTGSRPDRSLYEELQVHECYATQGPMKLAAKLLGETSADCLDQTSHGPEVLRNPEPNFYILGMKSYGRNSNFLIQVGLQQIVDVFTLIENDWGVASRPS